MNFLRIYLRNKKLRKKVDKNLLRSGSGSGHLDKSDRVKKLLEAQSAASWEIESQNCRIVELCNDEVALFGFKFVD
jgi:hypothetical protein